MLRSGHGKPGGGAARFSEVRGAAVVGGSAVTSRSASSRSGTAGGRASAVGQPLGSTTEARRAAGAEAGGACRAQSALTPGRLTAHRAWVETWAAGSGLRNRPVDLVARGPSDRAGMRGEVPPLAGLADFAATGLELPASGRTCAGTERRKDPAVETAALAGD